MTRFLIVFMLLASVSIGQTVTGYTGDLNDGEAVTVLGSGFGTKTDQTTWMFDDLSNSAYSSLIDGDYIPTTTGDNDYGYVLYDGVSPIIDANAPWGSSSGWPIYEDNHAFLRVPGSPVYSNERRASTIRDGGRPHGDTEFLLLDYWFYSTSSRSEGSAGHLYNKIFRIWPGNFDYGHISGYSADISYNPGHDPVTGIVTYRIGSNLYPVEGEWSHITVWTDCSGTMSDVVGSSQGIIKAWHNNVPKAGTTILGYKNPPVPSSVSGFTLMRSIGIEPQTGADHTGQINLWGDIYMDNTLSRVAIGDASSWANVRHYELQPITSWSASSIGITVNTGSFIKDESAYLFAIGSDGSAGTPFGIIIGDSGVGEEPPLAQPTALEATGGLGGS